MMPLIPAALIFLKFTVPLWWERSITEFSPCGMDIPPRESAIGQRDRDFVFLSLSAARCAGADQGKKKRATEVAPFLQRSSPRAYKRASSRAAFVSLLPLPRYS